jgi:hypothetical protein
MSRYEADEPEHGLGQLRDLIGDRGRRLERTREGRVIDAVRSEMGVRVQELLPIHERLRRCEDHVGALANTALELGDLLSAHRAELRELVCAVVDEE